MTQAERPPTSRISVRKKNAHQLFKTDMCKLFQQGVCRHGESCAFAHSADEVRHKPDLTRTSMCRTVLRGGICSDALCSFAHDQASLRTTCGFFKTRMCNYARSGKCRSGAACRFAHAPEELRSLAPPAPEEQGGGSTEQAHTWARGQPAEWSAGGSGGSGDSVSSGSSVAATVETRPPRRQRRVTAEDPGGGHAGRRPPSSGSSSGYGGGVSWASRVDPDSPKAPAAAPDGRRRGAAGGRSEPCSSIGATCLKVSHVPRYLRQEDLLSRLEEKFPALRESLDFFHCPWDDRARGNRGYALLNFENVERASAFQRCWANKELRPGAGEGRLRVESARPQALAGSAGALNQELCCQPLVRDAGGALRPRHAELHGQVAQAAAAAVEAAVHRQALEARAWPRLYEVLAAALGVAGADSMLTSQSGPNPPRLWRVSRAAVSGSPWCELSDHDLQAIVLERVAEIEAMKTEQGDAEYTIKNNMGLMGSLMSVTRRVGHVPLTKAILAKTVLAKEQAQKHGEAISYAVSYVCAKERNMASSSRTDIYSAHGRGSPRRLVTKTPEKKKGAPACVDMVDSPPTVGASTLKGHVGYDALVYVIEGASGRREHPLVRGDRGFCMADLGGGEMAHVHTEMPNLLLDEKEKMLAKRASRDKAKAAAKARPRDEEYDVEDLQGEGVPAAEAPKEKINQDNINAEGLCRLTERAPPLDAACRFGSNFWRTAMLQDALYNIST
ncbi:unnamed protein product [Prorocentrum cordatum]|uniref:C3H1-type domain-containing protein n=1 Tax=Prorocentrum cordatum TaxID=2364126 RepID=A0ABN9SRZ4_9DINO|nr:unnamed protein product [Polarella glacialis]